MFVEFETSHRDGSEETNAELSGIIRVQLSISFLLFLSAEDRWLDSRGSR